jgi:predicted DNA-binding protein (MmcQ/YjbR family)
MPTKTSRGLDGDALRKLCKGWPGVSVDIKWESNVVASVGGKMFAMVSTNTSLSFKVADDRFLEYTDRPEIIPAPYLARARWVAIMDTKHFATGTLQDFVRDAYGVVRGKLSKELQRELGPLPASKQ